jgi:hypothetical protein
MAHDQSNKQPPFIVYLIIILLLLLVSFSLWNTRAAEQAENYQVSEQSTLEY